MSRNFPQEIQEQLDRLQPIEQEMSEQKEVFISELISYLRDWYWSQTESIVKGYTEITKSLGKDKLTLLKGEVRGLQDHTDELVRQEFEKDSLWWHLRSNRLNVSPSGYIQSEYESYLSESMPNIFDTNLGTLGGKLGEVLDKYGYIAARSEDYKAGKAIWRKSTSGYYGGDYYREPFRFNNWPEQLKLPIKRYNELYKQAIQIAQGVGKIKLEQAKSESEDLWDSA